ncbi:MAG: carbohydrate-binding protein, partial [Planctomycetota bacterium]
MKIESCLRRRCVRPASIVRALACLALWSLACPAARGEGGSLLIPAWSFARGNARIDADPDGHADAGPVVASGPRRPWGWAVQFDVDLPVDGEYTFQVCYASAEPRPVQFFVDDKNMSKVCDGVTLDPKSSGQPDRFTWRSSGAKWQGIRNQWGRLLGEKLKKGVHVVKIARRGPLPHLVALRVTSKDAFPADWTPPLYRVKDIGSVPAKYRGAFASPIRSNAAFLKRDIERMIRLFGPRYPDGPEHLKQAAALEKKPQADAFASLYRRTVPFWTGAPPKAKRGGSLVIPAWTFDRGNVRIYASPDRFADAEPLVGSDPEHTGQGAVEYDIDFPASGEYSLKVKYAAAEARPVEVFVDGRSMGKVCHDITFGSAPFEIPVKFSWDSSSAKHKSETLDEWGVPRRMPITQGKHTLKLARRGPLPHLIEFRLESPERFPKGWKQPPRRMAHIDRVPARERSVFLPPDGVNIAALRLGIEDMIATLGPEYPRGPEFLERLAKFEKEKSTFFVRPAGRAWACEEGVPEEERTMEKDLAALRSDALLAHPALKFEKLLFFKRKTFKGNTYQDNKHNAEGGSLCVLS